MSEKVALAEAIAERLQGRQLANLVQNRGGNISTSDETGKTRDIAAAKAGLGSGKTLEAAQKVVEQGAPELVEAMDKGKVSRPLCQGSVKGAGDDLPGGGRISGPMIAGNHSLPHAQKISPLIGPNSNGNSNAGSTQRSTQRSTHGTTVTTVRLPGRFPWNRVLDRWWRDQPET